MLMYQNEIKFFWPLTEQIDLDLDYTPCANYQAAKIESFGTLQIGNGGWGATTISNALVNPTITFEANGQERMRFTNEGIMMMGGGAKKAGYWAINANDFRIYRDKKPNWIARKATQLVFGWKWIDEC